MVDARHHILAGIRQGLRVAQLPDAASQHPVNSIHPTAGSANDFITEVERLSGQAIRVQSSAEAAQAVADLCRERGWSQILAWAWEQIGCTGLAETLARAGVVAVHDGTPADLVSIPAGLTGAEAALADTGTLVLCNGPGRSPLASLLPPVHVALLDARRIFPNMRSYWLSLGNPAEHVRATSNLVFISGPSRTSDIERITVLGMHGPRELIVIAWG